jgi:hypothetical protein
MGAVLTFFFNALLKQNLKRDKMKEEREKIIQIQTIAYASIYDCL